MFTFVGRNPLPKNWGYLSNSEFDNTDAETGSNHDRMSIASSNHSHLNQHFYHNISLTYFLHRILGGGMSRLRGYLTGPADAIFYESVRMQPFSSGAYLRGFLMSGFSTLFFHAYSITFWKYGFSSHPDLSETQNCIKSVLLCWLCVQLSISLLQFPLRLNLHVNFFKSSRSADLDSAIGILRTTLQVFFFLFFVRF